MLGVWDVGRSSLLGKQRSLGAKGKEASKLAAIGLCVESLSREEDIG